MRILRFAALAAVMLAAPTARADVPKRPNVLFIVVDDMRDWVGYLGRNPQAKTPHIDRLAKRGVAFTRSYCAAPVCNPSRAALMSGLRPSTTGVYDNSDDWRRFISEDLPLTTTLRRAGYFVCGAGKIYHERWPRRSEWDHYQEIPKDSPKPPKGRPGVGTVHFGPLDCKDEELDDFKITDYAIAQLGKKHDKPFFLACGLHKPHLPWYVPRKYYDMHPLKDIQLPPYLKTDLDDVPPAGIRMARPEEHKTIVAAGQWKNAIQGYLAAISFTDMNVGRLLDALDKSAYKDNTIIVFWSDHGWHLGEKDHWRKFALWEETTRSPLLWVVPGLTKAGGVCDRTVDFMTVYPTLTDLCGIATPKHVEGKSIRSLLANPKAEWSEPALTTFRFKNHAVRTDGWRYIRYANGDEELYDHAKDPNEWTNLAKLAAFADRKVELRKLLPKMDAPEGGRKKKTAP